MLYEATKKPRVMWAWVCPVTGIVLDETWGSTESYAENKTKKFWRSKDRFQSGEMRAVRVTVELLTDDEMAKERAEFSRWKAERDEREAKRQDAPVMPSNAELCGGMSATNV
jgi:hypothetical protein